jgi:tetratricopeptide (TPR) repeat protein/HEAT repeat protein
MAGGLPRLDANRLNFAVLARAERRAYVCGMRLSALLLGWLVALGALGASSVAEAQFNPAGRRKKPPPAASKATRAPAKPAADAPVRPAAAASANPSDDALIARYTAIALSQPGADFPVQRLAELYRSRDGKLDALIADLARRAGAGGATRLPALLALALAYKHDGNFEQAIATYERALAEAPGSVPTELAVARLYSERGQRDQAAKRFESALPRITDPAQREEVLRALRTLALDDGDIARARRFHEALVKAQKGAFFVRGELGRELYTRGSYALAAEELGLVVKAAAGDHRVLAPALRDYGRALAKAGARDRALKELQRALSVAGAQSGVRREIYEVLLELYRAEGRLGELLAELEKRGARDAEEQRLLASLYEETGKLDKALGAYKAVLERDPRDVGTRLKLVHIHEVQGELELAIREYEALARAAPRNPDFVFRLADALIQRGDRKRALEALRALEARVGDDEQVLTALVDFYERVGEKAGSLALLQRLSTKGGSDPEHLVELGSRYWREGDKKKAIATWQRLRTASRDRTTGLVRLGELYLEHDLVDEALALLEEAVRLDPKQLRPKKAYALALERAGTTASTREGKKHHHDAALALWERLLKDAGKSSELKREARQHIVTLWNLSGSLAPRSAALARRLNAAPPDLEAGRLLAEAEIRMRRYPEAERTLNKVVAAAPGDLESLSRLERVLGLQRKLAEAIAVLERLARADPKRARECYQKMADYAAELYRDDDAIRYISRVVELSPDDAEGHKKLGEMQRRRGDAARATAAFRAAIQKNERLFPVYFDLAELLLGQGQAEEADQLLRSVLRRAPDDELVVRAARLSLQINLGRNSVDQLENDLVPLALDNPDRPLYRRLLVELYGAVAYPLLHRIESSDPNEVKAAEAELKRLGERAIKPLLDALGDSRGSQQETATTLLTYVGNPSAGPALFAYATGSGDPRLRARAMLAVGALRDKSLAPKLLAVALPGDKTLSGASDPVVLAAAWGLARLGSADARAALLELAEKGAPGPRALSLLGISLSGDRRSARIIGRALADPDAGSLPRAAAAFAAGELGLVQHASLLGELSESPDPTLAGAALVALARLSVKSADERIARRLVTADPELRDAARAAALVLGSGVYRKREQPLPIPSGELDVARVIDGLLPAGYGAADERLALIRLEKVLELALVQRTRSSTAGARTAIQALGRDGGRLPFSMLLLKSADDAPTRKLAGEIAARITRALVPAFIALAEHPAADVRAEALGFLSLEDHADAVRAVVNGVKDPAPDTQRAVLSHLEARHAAGVDLVIPLLAQADWSLRAVTAEALGRMIRRGEPKRAVLALEQAALGDGTALVREAALRALAKAAPELSRRALEQAAGGDPEPRVRKTAAALAAAL